MKWLLFILSFVYSLNLTYAQSYIDPELERYFESEIGYMSESNFRDAPLSVETRDFRNTIKRKNEGLVFSVLPEPDYTKIPLHYDIKKKYTSGAISFYVMPDNDDVHIKTYTPVEVNTDKSNYLKVLSELNELGFILGGYETDPNVQDKFIIFGWIEDKNFDRLKDIKHVYSYSLSAREIKAPLTDVSIIVKVPNNRDVNIFKTNFIEKLKSYGFEKESEEIIEKGKKYRFTFIKFTGKIPLDKTKILIKNPFVLKVRT